MKKEKIFKSVQGKKDIIQNYDNHLKEWTVVYKDEYLQTKYGKTYVIKSGDSSLPPLILLHGTGTNSAMWKGDIEVLCKSYYVISIDIVGEAGKSEEIRHSLETNEHSLWIKEVMDKLDIKKSAFMGNSLGGWMVLKFAINYPKMINQVVLIATSGLANAKISFLFKAIFNMMRGEKGIYKLAKIAMGDIEVPDEVLESNIICMKNYNPRMGSLPVFTDDELKRIKTPVLAVGGEFDALLKTKESLERINGLLANSEVKILNGVGHAVFDITDTIVDFLRKTEA